jgi:calcineurin-like phosphoesterase family protein
MSARKSALKKARPRAASPRRKVHIVDPAAWRAKHKRYPLPKSGHAFTGDKIPPGFHTIIDKTTHPIQIWRDLPPPTGPEPFRLDLGSILDASAIASIVKSGKLIFHTVGDTGGVNTPTYQENVASYMSRDFLPNDPADSPSFFYHLGDVVYYEGESANYFPEFYEPYTDYHAPIFAIPGNHDGDIDPQTGESSLQAFVRNFCAQAPVLSQDNHDAPRTSMTQPNVYWTLTTPLATIVGLYSNCPEGGQIAPAQIAWLESELAAAPKGRALIVAVHHPIYSAYGSKPGSQHLKDVLEQACTNAKRAADLVLTGHVHNYQRFSAGLYGKKNVPFIVAGAGGYNKKLHTLSTAFHSSKTPIAMPNSDGVLESYNDQQHGYLKVTVTKKTIRTDYYAVPDAVASPGTPLPVFDTCTTNVG